MVHLEIQRRVGEAELPPMRFDIDDEYAWEDVLQLIKLECTYSEEPVYVAFGEYKGVE